MTTTTSPLAKDFSFPELIKFVLPSICMMIFLSTYTIIDGIFVANLVGEDALAAVNLIFPIVSSILAIGLMFTSGGTAVIAKMLGEGKDEEARQFLTTLYIIGTCLGILISIIAFTFIDEILVFLNVSETLHHHAYNYLSYLAFFFVAIFYMEFVQAFLIAAGRPGLAFLFCVFGGITNIVLDYFLISPDFADLGVRGAALATGLGYVLAGTLGILFFFFNKTNLLRFAKPKAKLKTILLSMYNGLSELITSSSTAITTFLFNTILLKLAGDSGVAAISVILYLQMFQNALYFGFVLGVAPIIAFKFGEKNSAALNKIVKQSLIFVSFAAVLIISLTLLFREQAVGIFINPSSSTFEMALLGLTLFSPAYAFMGFNIFFSALFTALSNGKISGTISLMRSLVFLLTTLLILPLVFGLNGVWIAVPVAEAMAIFVSIYFYRKYKDNYEPQINYNRTIMSA